MHQDASPPETLQLLILKSVTQGGELHGYEIANCAPAKTSHDNADDRIDARPATSEGKRERFIVGREESHEARCFQAVPP